MAAEPHQELIIIKRHGGHGDGHHGGAWKIAFADFMTAMMALFLVLWLISATNPKQKIVIAHYFNPVKLAEVSVNKKGLEDPTPTEGGHGGPRAGDVTEKRLELPPMQEKRALYDRGEARAGHDEAGLFRDPYAILSEIAADPLPGDKSKAVPKAVAATSNLDTPPPENIDTFRDPFSTTPSLESPPSPESPDAPANAQSLSNAANANSANTNPAAEDQPKTPADTPNTKAADVKAAEVKAADVKASNTAQAVPLPAPTPLMPPVVPPVSAVQKEKQPVPAKEAAKNPPPVPLTAEQQAAANVQANEADAGKLRTEIAAAMHKDAVSLGTPNIEVKSTAEGVLISLTDENTYAMFAVGSAEPQAKTIEVMGKVAQLLKNYPGLIVVRGHTDGRPYKSATYDNWQLSSARAQMAHYMLVRGGLDEKRIDRIEGYADHQLKQVNDPLAAENRRIEILLRKDKP